MRLAAGRRYRLPNGKVVTAQRDARRKVWVLTPRRGRAVWIITPGGKLLALTGGVESIHPNQIRVPGWHKDDLTPLSDRQASSPLDWLRRLLGLAPEPEPAPVAVSRPNLRRVSSRRRPYRGPDVLDRVMLIIDEEDEDDDMADRLRYMLDDDD